MWQHLRTYALYFLHYRPGQHTEGQIRAAQQELFKFAEYAEKHLEGKLLTSLIHRAVVHIPAQVLATLPGAFLREDFGERLVRWTKKFIKGHSTVRAAQASAAVCLTQMGLRIVKSESPTVDAPLNLVRSHVNVRPQDKGDEYGTSLHYLVNANTGEDQDEVCVLACIHLITCPMCVCMFAADTTLPCMR